MINKLKSCPFCSGKATFGYYENEEYAYCTQCSNRTRTYGIELRKYPETKNTVLKAWNRRPVNKKD